MALTYNGVTLRIETSQFDERAVYSPDGNDLLYTHIVCRVTSVWSPEATATAGRAVAIESLDALRLALMTPRKTLIVTVPSGGAAGVKTLLRSPLLRPGGATSYNCDANLGPKPISLDVLQVLGEQTAIVEYAIETWIAEYPTTHAFLAHRWETIHNLDQDYYTTKITRGVAVLRGDWVNEPAAGVLPGPATRTDFSRSNIGHTIPDGFKRIFATISVSPDGLLLSYEFHDQEQPAMIVNTMRSRISRIAGVYTEAEGSTLGAIPGMIGGAAQAISGGAAEMQNSGNPASAVAAALPGVVRALDALPRVRLVLQLEVWGRKSATKKDLFMALAAGILAFKFNNLRLDEIMPQWVVNILDGTAAALGVTTLRTTVVGTAYAVDLFNRHAKFEGTFEVPVAARAALARLGMVPGPVGADIISAVNSGAFNNDIAGLTTTSIPAGSIHGPLSDANTREWADKIKIQTLPVVGDMPPATP